MEGYQYFIGISPLLVLGWSILRLLLDKQFNEENTDFSNKIDSELDAYTEKISEEVKNIKGIPNIKKILGKYGTIYSIAVELKDRPAKLRLYTIISLGFAIVSLMIIYTTNINQVIGYTSYINESNQLITNNITMEIIVEFLLLLSALFVLFSIGELYTNRIEINKYKKYDSVMRLIEEKLTKRGG